MEETICMSNFDFLKQFIGLVSGVHHALNYLSCIKLFHIIFMSVFIKVHFSLWGVKSCCTAQAGLKLSSSL